VTETVLEGPDDDEGGMARRIRLTITLSSRTVTLTLERNDHVPSNVTVIVGQNGRLTTSETSDVTNRVYVILPSHILSSLWPPYVIGGHYIFAL